VLLRLKIQKSKNPKIQKSKNPKIQKSKNPKIQKSVYSAKIKFLIANMILNLVIIRGHYGKWVGTRRCNSRSNRCKCE
jgi:hypothetical protein